VPRPDRQRHPGGPPRDHRTSPHGLPDSAPARWSPPESLTRSPVGDPNPGAGPFPLTADREACGNLIGENALADGTDESIEDLGAWADAFKVADAAGTPCPRCDRQGRIRIPCPDFVARKMGKGKLGPGCPVLRGPVPGLRWHRRARPDRQIRLPLRSFRTRDNDRNPSFELLPPFFPLRK